MPLCTWATPLAVISPTSTPHSILANAEILRDVGGKLDFPHVLALAQQPGKFTRTVGSASFGFTRDAIWLRFQVKATQPHWLVVQPSFLDQVSLFVPNATGQYVEQRQGDHIPFSQRVLPLRTYAFPLVTRDQAITYYLRVSSSSSIPMSAMIYTPERYYSDLNQEQLFFGFLFGMIGLAMSFAVLCLVWLPLPVYRVTLQYLFWFLVYQLSVEGFDQQWFYPETPWYADRVLVFSMAMLFAVGTQFTQIFLGLAQNSPRLNHWYTVLYRIQWGFAGLVLIGADIRWISPALQLFSMGIFLLSLSLILRAIKWRYPHSKLLFWIHVTPYLTLLLTAARTFGFLPFNALTAHPTALVASVHIALLNLLIVLTVRDGERANRDAQTRALTLAYQLEVDLENTIASRTEALTHEIEQHHRTALALREAKENAERMLAVEQTRQQQQQQFIHMIAHELRTPLAIIEAAVRMIEVLTEKAMPDLAPRFSKIRRAMRRLTGVIDNSLADGRLAAGKLTPQLSVIVMTEFLHNLRQQLVLPENITLEIELIPTDIQLQADAFLLRLALLNLLDNAIKYSPDGGNVRVHISQDERFVCCQVEDQGRGIPASALAHLFTKFYRVQAHEKIPGVGLGLYLVQQVAQLHGGDITVRSQEGMGSGFILRILR